MILTLDEEWDPAVLDCEGKIDNEVWFDVQSSFPEGPANPNFNEVEDCKHRSDQHRLYFFDAETFTPIELDDAINTFVSCSNITTKSNETEYEALKPLSN